ncbi:MAG TPA: hypothetical protein VK622_06030 [Puia sp.]|nr:hypothetical protein [Puia sp.]
MDQDEFTLDCNFIHNKLVLQLQNRLARQITEQKITALKDMHQGGIVNTFINSILTDAVLEILKTQEIGSLEEMLLKEEKLKNGKVVWIEQDFVFKGAVKARSEFEKAGKASYVTFYTTLKRYSDLKITGQFNAEHLFGQSSVYNLTGKKTVFMLAYIEEVKSGELVLRPIFIGRKMMVSNIGFHRTTEHLQLYIEDFDEFKLARKLKSKNFNIELNKNYSEETVKKWFGEIIHEKNIPKDWGGERSDLFTDHIHISGKRYNAAFLFKGPAKFTPMTINQLGKRGDQIVRLYDEPAEIYFLHHCHFVRTEIHKFMRAFSGNFTRITRYCVIDGIDTLRVLKAYKKI